MLSEIVEIPEFTSFYLAGGTNLALKYNHRVSTDINLFTNDLKSLELYFLPILKQKFNNRLVIKSITKDTLRLTIDAIKVDFLQWLNVKKMLFEVQNFPKTNWKLANDIDVAAMKINAIINRGTIKDFYDKTLLLKHYSLNTIIEAYKLKYDVTSDNQVIQYLDDFHEADLEKESSIQIVDFDLKT